MRKILRYFTLTACFLSASIQNSFAGSTKVAFVGDNGTDGKFQSVPNLIQRENVDLV